MRTSVVGADPVLRAEVETQLCFFAKHLGTRLFRAGVELAGDMTSQMTA